MSLGPHANDTNESEPSSSVNPWLIILLTAPVPLFLLVLLFVNWSNQKSELHRVISQFEQRQNTALAYDAMSVAGNISDLLEKSARDVSILALVPPTAENFRQFHDRQMGTITVYDRKKDTSTVVPWTFYDRIAYVNEKGDTALELVEGKVETRVRPLSACRAKDLCDRDLIETALKLPEGKIRYGRLMRYYRPEGAPADDQGAGIWVAYRAAKGLFILGLDYRQLRDNLTDPTFPYRPKTDLLRDYKQGNYIYAVDADNNVILHPKYSNVIGIDRNTGEWVPPIVTDADEGTHPINIAAYQSGMLKEYFDRLLKKSFVEAGVDIFQADNLAGAKRVLSVVPISLSRGQYQSTGVFGHVVVGCSLDHFQEPKNKLIPYY